MNFRTTLSTYGFVLCTLLSMALLLSCNNDSKTDSLSGPSTVGDSIYVVVVDANGNPINNAYVYYTCWLPSTPGQPITDCRATVFVNSSGVKKDTTSYIAVAPVPAQIQASCYIENEKSGNVDFTIYNYEKTKRLLTLVNGELAPGIYLFSLDTLYEKSILPFTQTQQASTNGVYWLQLKRDYDTTIYWKKLIVFDKLRPMYYTNARGYVPISYNSLPFGELFERTLENGQVIGTFFSQGDYLYVKCTASGYKPNFGMINAYERKEHILKVVLEKE